MGEKKPLLCRLGIHTSTFRDCSLLGTTFRCNWCMAVIRRG
ncbi:hypothetical protein [Williamsia serinedens]|nr:hypothetical protein [Williamsia serinedens]